MILRCATSNPGKLRELRMAAEHFGFTEFTIEPLPGLSALAPPAETAPSFEGNAIAKAVYYSLSTQDPLFADDSGLVVDALHGEPGIHSARYAGERATDALNNALLRERIRPQANRAARFVCVIALAQHGRLWGCFRGEVEGLVLDEERGSGGFGYDPLFFFPPLGCTLAEVDAHSKMNVSHRGKALRAMLAFLREGGPLRSP